MNHGRNTVAPIKFGLIEDVFVQADYTSSGTTVALDEDNSSPGVGIERDDTGQYTVTFPAGNWAHPVDARIVIAESVAGNFLEIESIDAEDGELKFETSQTRGTAADPTGDCKFYIYFKVGRPV